MVRTHNEKDNHTDSHSVNRVNRVNRVDGLLLFSTREQSRTTPKTYS